MNKNNENVTWVIGSKGLLATAIQSELTNQSTNFIVTSRDDVDYSNIKSLLLFALSNKVSSVVNCAAISDVDKCEIEKSLAYKINVELPRNLAIVSHQIEAKFIQISSDFVFGSDDYFLFEESAKKCPVNYYGLTKSIAEDEVIEVKPDAIILRTSWLYGKYRQNFITNRIEELKQNRSIEVIADIFGAPTNVDFLARTIIDMFKENDCKGIYHANSMGFTSWYYFIQEAKKLLKSESQIFPISHSELERPAKRARWSLISHGRKSISLLPISEPWQNGLMRFLEK